MCCQSDADLKEQVDMTEDGTQWGILSKDGKILEPLYKTMIRSHLDPRTTHTSLWCQLNTFSLTPVIPLPSYSLKSHHILSFSSLQHTAIRKVTCNAFMGNELFLLYPKVLTSAWSSQQYETRFSFLFLSANYKSRTTMQTNSKGDKALEKLSSFKIVRLVARLQITAQFL